MFDWNENGFQAHSEINEIENGILCIKSNDWESFENELTAVKYNAKHTAKRMKREQVFKRIKAFTNYNGFKEFKGNDDEKKL